MQLRNRNRAVLLLLWLVAGLIMSGCESLRGAGAGDVFKESAMSGKTQLLWEASGPTGAIPTDYIFCFDPVVGLTDVDFHAINDKNWARMRCPDGKTPATLVVPPSARFAEIQTCLELLATKGGFKTVRISIGQP